MQNSPTPATKSYSVQADTLVADIRAALQDVGTFKAEGLTDFIPNPGGSHTEETSIIEVDLSDPSNHKLHIVETKGTDTREYIFTDGFMYTKALNGSGWLKRPTLSDADNPYIGYFLLPDDATARETDGGGVLEDGTQVRHFVVQSSNPNLGADVYVDMNGILKHVTGSGYTLDITEPGAPVNIQAPDPSQVTEG